ncbi:MAG: hypothetical protein ACR2QG_03735 [Gammaproteobacteria bacterium]
MTYNDGFASQGVILGFLTALLAGCATAPEQSSEKVSAADPHAHHAMHDKGKDELGRQLYDMKHDMSPEAIQEMRDRGIFPPAVTDQQVNGMMRSMGPNYVWYVSGGEVTGKRGVLILAHGFGTNGDMAMRRRMDEVGQVQPAAMAMGMSMGMSNHIQLALDDLTAAGAKEIAVIPVVSSRYSTLMRQWEYIFKLRDEPAYATVPRVSTRARLYFSPPMESHPFVVDILSDYAQEISKDKSKEEIIIVAHGPIDAADNQRQLDMLAGIGAKLKAEGYAAVHPVTLQDDAPKEVRQANVERMRQLVTDIEARGNTPLVITNLIGTRLVQKSIRRDLNGLGYRYNFRGLVLHEKFIDWVQVASDEAFGDKT